MSGSNIISGQVDGSRSEMTPADVMRAAVTAHHHLGGINPENKARIASLVLTALGVADGDRGPETLRYTAQNSTSVANAIETVARTYPGLFTESDPNHQSVRPVPSENANLHPDLQRYLGSTPITSLPAQERIGLIYRAQAGTLPERQAPQPAVKPAQALLDDPQAAQAVADIRDPSRRLSAIMARRSAFSNARKAAHADARMSQTDPRYQGLLRDQAETARREVDRLRGLHGSKVIPLSWSTPNAAEAAALLASGRG